MFKFLLYGYYLVLQTLRAITTRRQFYTGLQPWRAHHMQFFVTSLERCHEHIPFTLHVGAKGMQFRLKTCLGKYALTGRHIIRQGYAATYGHYADFHTCPHTQLRVDMTLCRPVTIILARLSCDDKSQPWQSRRYNSFMNAKADNRARGWLYAVSLFAFFFSSVAGADIMVRVEESFNGQLPITALHWFGQDRSTRDDGNRYVVTRLDEGRIYTIDRLTQSYKISELPAPGYNEATPDVRALLKDETRNIGKWSTRKYEVIGAATAGMKIVIWATKDVDINLEYFRKVMAGLARRPGSEWMAAYRQIDGFPVLQEVRLEHKGAIYHGQTRVVAVEERNPPQNIYSPPDDYEEITEAGSQ